MKCKDKSEWARIEKLIEYFRLPSAHAFAKHIGLLSGEKLYQIKRGNNGISKKFADIIVSKFPEISKAWVLTGEGDSYPKNQNSIY